MNRYSILVGIIYAIATPIGVHIGLMMAYSNWMLVFLELGILTIVNLVAPFLWIKAQTVENLKENKKVNYLTIQNNDEDNELEDKNLIQYLINESYQ